MRAFLVSLLAFGAFAGLALAAEMPPARRCCSPDQAVGTSADYATGNFSFVDAGIVWVHTTLASDAPLQVTGVTPTMVAACASNVVAITANCSGGDLNFAASNGSTQWTVAGATGKLVSAPGRGIDLGAATVQGNLIYPVNDATATATACAASFLPSGAYTAGDCIQQIGDSAGTSFIRVYQSQGAGVTMGTGGGIAPLVGLANATTADVTSSGASNLISYTLPANSLTQTNRCIRIKGWGTALNNANAKTVALDFGSQTIISKILTPSIANTTWSFQATVCRSGSNTQDIYAEAFNPMGTAVSSTDGNTILYQAARTAGTQTETSTIVIKGKTTTATTTDVTMDGLTVEYM